MTTKRKFGRALAQACLFASLGAVVAGLGGCSGDDVDAQRPEQPGGEFPPQPGTGAPIPVTSATTIVASIQRVTVPDDGKPVVEVYLKDDHGYSLTGLPAANIRFVLARLEPAANGNSSTWHALTRRVDPFPGTPAPVPAEAVTGTGPASQATTETATSGVWTERGSGVYTYQFLQGLKADPAVPFDGTMPHRVGLEIRLGSPVVPANNPTFTFNPVTNLPIESGREIVDNDTCNACHDNLVFHGGARFDLQYCVMCHEAYSSDAQTGNTIDLKVMIHKIHSGEALPSVAAGRPYGFFGNRNAWSDFSHVIYPQDRRNCTTCHEESDEDTPQASNWRVTVNTATCTSCHDDVDFATGANHGGVAATDDTCTSCHGPSSGVASVQQAHVIAEQAAAAKFAYEVLNVTNTAPGQRPTVTIRVVDPTNGNAPYDIRAAGGPFQNSSASLAVDIAFSTRPDFTNTGSGSAPTPTSGTPAQPIRIDFKASGVADPTYPGGFTATATLPIPATATGSGEALIEGRPAVDANGDGTLDRLAVTSVGKAFAITDPAASAYRQVVDIEKCNDCHEQLTLHGNSRTGNAELCAACHNPNATDINRRVAGSQCESVTGTLDDQTIDLKYMVHAIHAGAQLGVSYKVCGYNNTGYDFGHVAYPGKVNNCEGCHLAGTYYPPNSATAVATTIDAGPDRSTPADDVAITAGAAACSACHADATARQHMQLNGASFDAVKAADSTTPAAPVETCGNCHGAGQPADVATAHGVGEFQYNE